MLSYAERLAWSAHLEQSPLRWTEENSFDEDKDHSSAALQHTQPQNDTAGPGTTSTKRDDDTEVDDASAQAEAETDCMREADIPLPYVDE